MRNQINVRTHNGKSLINC